ncbi:armadillo repeat-containing protein 6-like [Daphnia carinata]|uniref:armadillo repeat-containing protein 6-like n=1 Tax=Daphnia carinata TaxID=120202 RepID=UPI002579B456|nr:armadillo repeat-containing protein 6-like [Daphnia carinata]
MVKVITQETFDAVVKENVEEFGLELEEARKDAIKQFIAQGVDLTNIVTDGPTEGDQNHTIVVALQNLSKLLENAAPDDAEVMTFLKELETQCNIDLAHRIMAEKNGAFPIIVQCLKRYQNNLSLKEQCLKSMASLIQGYPDLVTHEGIELLCNLLEEDSSLTTVTLVLNVLCHSCRMHENNRESFMANFKLAARIRKLLESPPSRNHAEVVVKCCQLIRAVVSDDDVRVEFGRAHEYACMIAEQENGLELLTSLLTEFQTEKTVINELLPTLSRLAVRNEFCQRIVELGGLQFVMDVLAKYYDDKELVESSFFLIKSLAGNDDVKREVSKGNAVPLIAAALGRHKCVAALAEMGCAAIAALCLRTPDNAAAFVANGVGQLVVDILKTHKLKVGVERQASMAIRNIVSRRKDLTTVFLEAGVEELLQTAMKRTQRAPTVEIKAALRDLGCHVQLQEQWTGKGTAMTN